MRTIISEPMMFEAVASDSMVRIRASVIADGDELWGPVWEFLDLYEHELRSVEVIQDHRWYFAGYTETTFTIRR